MYDQFANRYAGLVRDGALKSIVDPLAERLLGIDGDVEGVRVLDAGCGERGRERYGRSKISSRHFCHFRMMLHA